MIVQARTFACDESLQRKILDDISHARPDNHLVPDFTSALEREAQKVKNPRIRDCPNPGEDVPRNPTQIDAFAGNILVGPGLAETRLHLHLFISAISI